MELCEFKNLTVGTSTAKPRAPAHLPQARTQLRQVRGATHLLHLYALESNHKVFAGYSSYARFPLAGSRTFRRKSQKTDSYFQPHTVCKFSKTENGSMVRTRGSVSFALKIVGISTNDFAGEISPTRAALLAAGPFADNVGILIPICNQRQGANFRKQSMHRYIIEKRIPLDFALIGEKNEILATNRAGSKPFSIPDYVNHSI